ncbi:MAG: RIO1 family regulatory kinase/ATPase, partial [Nitrosopumilaceae archaeon]
LLFDLGSAVDLRHPNANEFLKRDINNITKFFVKRGLTVANPVDVLLKVTK